jgi:hypothetical protein
MQGRCMHAPVHTCPACGKAPTKSCTMGALSALQGQQGAALSHTCVRRLICKEVYMSPFFLYMYATLFPRMYTCCPY